MGDLESGGRDFSKCFFFFAFFFFPSAYRMYRVICLLAICAVITVTVTCSDSSMEKRVGHGTLGAPLPQDDLMSEDDINYLRMKLGSQSPGAVKPEEKEEPKDSEQRLARADSPIKRSRKRDRYTRFGRSFHGQSPRALERRAKGQRVAAAA